MNRQDLFCARLVYDFCSLLLSIMTHPRLAKSLSGRVANTIHAWTVITFYHIDISRVYFVIKVCSFFRIWGGGTYTLVLPRNWYTPPSYVLSRSQRHAASRPSRALTLAVHARMYLYRYRGASEVGSYNVHFANPICYLSRFESTMPYLLIYLPQKLQFCFTTNSFLYCA